MPATSQDTGAAAALKAAWNGDPNHRPEQVRAKRNYPTKTGPLRPTTTTNTDGVG